MKLSSEWIKEVRSTGLCVYVCVEGGCFFWGFFFFHFTNLILFPVLHICLSLSLLLDGWYSGFIHSREDITLVFSYYENELPRHIGHGHSPSSSCYLCCVCVLHHFEMGLAQSSQCSFFNRLWALFFGIYPQLQLSSKFQPHNVVLFLFRCLTASEESLLKLLNSTH